MIISYDEDRKLRTTYKKQFKASANCLYYFCDSNNYKLVCIAESDLLAEGCYHMVIGDIIIELPYFYLKIFAYKDGHFIPLEEALTTGVVTIDSVEFIAEFCYDDICKYRVKSEGCALEF